jgi:hypothetical protein
VGRGPFPRRGFVGLITEHLHFTASSRHFGEIVTAAYVLVIAFVPLFLPRVPFLAMATTMLGLLETVMHIGMIKMFRRSSTYCSAWSSRSRSSSGRAVSSTVSF